MDLDDDFGFTLVSEMELRKNEEELKKKIQEQTSLAVQTTKDLREKLNGLRAMILPLLNNMLADEDKLYIYWPDRVTKIQAFIKKMNAYVDG